MARNTALSGGEAIDDLLGKLSLLFCVLIHMVSLSFSAKRMGEGERVGVRFGSDCRNRDPLW